MTTSTPWQCRHCGGSAGARPRGLCHKCYDNPAIKALYPLRSGKKCAECGQGMPDNPNQAHHCPASFTVRPCPRCGQPARFLNRYRKTRPCGPCRLIARAKASAVRKPKNPPRWPLLFPREVYDRMPLEGGE